MSLDLDGRWLTGIVPERLGPPDRIGGPSGQHVSMLGPATVAVPTHLTRSAQGQKDLSVRVGSQQTVRRIGGASDPWRRVT